MNKKVVIVTGGSRGIGCAAVKSLLKSNLAYVVSCARSESPIVNELREDYNDGFEFLSGDISNEEFQNELVAVTLKKFGRIDSVIHNAGVLGPIQTFDSLSMDNWKSVFDINLFSIISLTKKLLPHIRLSSTTSHTHGKLIFVSSGAATTARKGWAAYCASKSALNMVVQSLAIEEPSLVSFALRPGMVDTEMQQQIREEGGNAMDPTFHSKIVGLKETNSLIPPEKTGELLKNLALNSKMDLSGSFLSCDDQKLKMYS